MAYQVLARKWRPQTFSSLIGQEPIVTALRNALSEGRIAQAYLFSGIRGVGKTSAARVLAKALNCERGPAADPCNECGPCREITAGSDLDVLEIDAATYSKVEQVRDLTENLRYAPARDRFKVVVLDEIHRLSRQAFDALLKIVEEPPPHLVFIFATTESEAVPATVLSRCQEFRFRRVPGETMAAHLRTLCDAEEIESGAAALRLIARAGEGSVRDSVALLDQLATFGSGSISDEEAVRLLGGLDTALFHNLLAAIVGGQPEGVGEVVDRIHDEGWNPRQIFAQFLAYTRDALRLSMGAPIERVDLPTEEAERLRDLAGSAGYENLLRMTQQLLASETTVRRSDAAVLAVEIAWLRAAELPKLTRVEDLLAGGPSEATWGEARESSARKGAGPDHPSTAAPSPARAADGTVELFLQEVSLRKQPLAAHLEAAQRLAFDEGKLAIFTPPGDLRYGARIERPSNRQVLDEALLATWGPGVEWLLRPGSIDNGAVDDSRPGDARLGERSGAGPEEEVAGAAEAADPRVQKVLDLFGGTVEGVEPKEIAGED